LGSILDNILGKVFRGDEIIAEISYLKETKTILDFSLREGEGIILTLHVNTAVNWPGLEVKCRGKSPAAWHVISAQKSKSNLPRSLREDIAPLGQK